MHQIPNGNQEGYIFMNIHIYVTSFIYFLIFNIFRNALHFDEYNKSLLYETGQCMPTNQHPRIILLTQRQAFVQLVKE